VLLSPAYLTTVVETLAALLCIGGIAGLATQRTARLGNVAGSAGILLAVSTALGGVDERWADLVYAQFAIVAVIGAAVGTVIYRSVSPTSLPQTVAGFHSLVGLAAVLTAVAEYLANSDSEAAATDASYGPDAAAATAAAPRVVELVTAGLATAIGGITCTGSLIAFAKLSGYMKSVPLKLPIRDWLNLVLASGLAVCIVWLALDPERTTGLVLLFSAVLISLLLGWHLVHSIGGADMPVVITILNSYSVRAVPACLSGCMPVAITILNSYSVRAVPACLSLGACLLPSPSSTHTWHALCVWPLHPTTLCPSPTRQHTHTSRPPPTYAHAAFRPLLCTCTVCVPLTLSRHACMHARAPVFQGWALCAEGFMLNLPLLTTVGALIGASGAILTYIMCKAMNRSVINVVLGGYGTSLKTGKGAKGGPPTTEGDDSGGGEPHFTDAEHVAQLLTHSKEVIVVPG
jgi:NAD/NADP transhydrogenase beta subunit